MLFIQASDLINSVKEIGILSVLILLIIGSIITAFKYWSNTLFLYFSSRLDKKDEVIKIIQEEYNKNLLLLIEIRHSDTLKTEAVISNNTNIQHEILETLKIMNQKLDDHPYVLSKDK